MQRYTSSFGTGPWIGYCFAPTPVRDLTCRGKPADYGMDIAMTGSEPQIELIQVRGSSSLYDEFLARHGYGSSTSASRSTTLSPLLASSSGGLRDPAVGPRLRARWR